MGNDTEVQPPSNAYIGDATKSCWSCHINSIPYSRGFCEECWQRIPVEVRTLYWDINKMPEPYAGLLREAVIRGLASALRPRPAPGAWAEHHRTRRPKARLSLLDLDL